jgi:hypothetical protein
MRTFVRISMLVSVTVLVACGSGPSGTGDDDDDDDDAEPAFVITSSEITLAPGQEVTKCFYFTTPNTRTLAIHRWVSDMTPGSHHMIYFRTLAGSQPPDGTVDESCGGGFAVPVYGTQIPHEEVAFPADDGEGLPLAQDVEPGSKGYFQMHYFNSSDEELTAHVELAAYALPDDAPYTRTDLFATYNNDISIPPRATDHVESATCGVVSGKFWSMSTHSHKQSIATVVKEGDRTVFSSTDWEHPGTAEFRAPPFYSFTSGQLTWECTYNNTGDNADRTVTAGQSARTDEMCMATGYYFPANGARGCIFANGQCQCLL